MELLLRRELIPQEFKIVLFILGFFIYFLPIIIQIDYIGFSSGLFFTNIILWRTPLPYLFLILNIIEYNYWTKKIIKNQEKITKLLENLVNSNNNNKKT